MMNDQILRRHNQLKQRMFVEEEQMRESEHYSKLTSFLRPDNSFLSTLYWKPTRCEIEHEDFGSKSDPIYTVEEQQTRESEHYSKLTSFLRPDNSFLSTLYWKPTKCEIEHEDFGSKSDPIYTGPPRSNSNQTWKVKQLILVVQEQKKESEHYSKLTSFLRPDSSFLSTWCWKPTKCEIEHETFGSTSDAIYTGPPRSNSNQSWKLEPGPSRKPTWEFEPGSFFAHGAMPHQAMLTFKAIINILVSICVLLLLFWVSVY